MKYIPWRDRPKALSLAKAVPLTLVRELVEQALDQPKPTTGLQQALQVVLKCGEHKDRLK